MKQVILLILAFVLVFATGLEAQTILRERSGGSDVVVDSSVFLPGTTTRTAEATTAYGTFDVASYTLGPSDVIEIEVTRHPEFSGRYVVNQEGKIQYKSVGDIEVKGLTKAQVAEKLKASLSQYVVSPEINVSILEYGSKVFYVMGEVGVQGQFNMRSENISVRDAIHLAGLPNINAAMRHCQLVTPTTNGRNKIRRVDLYRLLYRGDLSKNVMIKPGDILYVPSTIRTKVIRELTPWATFFGLTSGMAADSATGRTAAESNKKKLAF